VIKRTCFRLTVAYERVVRAYVHRRVRAHVLKLLDDFSSQTMTYREAKDALRDLMLSVARLEYK
jgi:hypothetical protein